MWVSISVYRPTFEVDTISLILESRCETKVSVSLLLVPVFMVDVKEYMNRSDKFHFRVY